MSNLRMLGSFKRVYLSGLGIEERFVQGSQTETLFLRYLVHLDNP